MSRNGKAGPAPAGGWLDGDQQRAWLAYIRVQLRLAYEMNRQPRRDQVVAVRRFGDGGDLQLFEIRRIVDALTP
jgi:hypothetical protein